MAITINGSGTITGISTGGLPDGIVDDGTLATSAVTSIKIADGAIINADVNASAAITASKLSATLDLSTKTVTLPAASVTAHATNPTKTSIEALGIALPASDLTGTIADARFPATLPAVSGANLTGIETVTKSSTAPASPSAGDQWFNTSASTVSSVSSNTMATYNGSVWHQMSNIPATASGGTTSESGGYKYHTFTTGSSFVVSNGPLIVDYLVVSGGGGAGKGGSGEGSGGGGAGGYTAVAGYSANGTIVVTIGNGGAGNTSDHNQDGGDGSASSFGSVTSTIGGGGGAGGGGSASTGNSGGSGGGGNGYVTPAPGAGTSGQGFSGGTGYRGVSYQGGGGGGASAVGGDGTSDTSVALAVGGAGKQWLNGTYYAGGGGGGSHSATTATTTGGTGGGGNGNRNGGAGGNGTANTGGGGGGSGNGGYGGSGGSGIVIVRYAV